MFSDNNEKEISIFLVGNKSDSISPELLEYIDTKATDFVKKYKLDGYLATSAKTGHQINDVFQNMTSLFLN